MKICARSGPKQKVRLCRRGGFRLIVSVCAPVAGFTLIELMVVIFILSVVALIVSSSLTPSEPYKIELAAGELAAALRHARGESLRTTDPHGVHIETAAKRVRVVRGAVGTIPPVPVYDVYQPVTKQLYEVDIGALLSSQSMTITNAPNWSSACNEPDFLFFDLAGRPRCGDPWGVLLDTGTLTLTWSGHTRVVAIDGETGRVTIQ